MLVVRLRAVLEIWWIGIFLLGGIALFAWIVRGAWDNVQFALHSVEVTGRVVDIRSRTVQRKAGDKATTHYSTTVEYEDAAGRTYRFAPDSVAGVPVLGPIPVRYHFEHPEDGRVAQFGETWGLLLLQLPFALVMMLGAASVFVGTWKDAVVKPVVATPAGFDPPVRAPTAVPVDTKAIAKSIERNRRRRGGQ